MRGGAKSPAQGREEKNIKQIIRINKMLGLNESSDFGLAPGEASVMRNWRVTADGSLALRPGTETVFELGGEPVRVKAARVHKNTVLLTLPGVEDMDAATVG